MKEIKTNGITILFVEVPEDSKNFEIISNRLLCNLRGFVLQLPEGQYQILGKSTELSEEQMKEICWQVSFGNYTGYKNYNQAKCSDFRDIVESSFSTVQESYLSLLEANGIVDRCLIDKPEFNYEFGEDGPTDSQLLSAEIHFEESFRQYQEAQSKVKHYSVLKKI